ncbi:DUF1467 family protein [Cognatishimia sp. MH4019]|uniref:DUF1467 family protein n=1 Tax=Cognatishimia sp. MH4019 TaxID=2854030 RepID=UPI001CD3846D|nr:DUF1467 family protein [Cognatishimia sp. MH4019]
MSITSAIVLFAVIWFMVLFIVLPLRLKTQGDVGEIVPGTHAGAPADAQLGKRVKVTTMIAFPLWVIIAGTILSGVITVRDLDWFERMSTPEVSGTSE